MAIPSTTIRCALAAAAWILLVSLTAPARADDAGAKSIRQAVMGHEAFILRCVEDQIDASSLRRAYERSQGWERDRIVAAARDLCESYYRGVNVCAAGGTDEAVKRLGQTKGEIEAALSDPLTRADNYEAILKLDKDVDRELTALRDLAEGRTDYCHGSNQ